MKKIMIVEDEAIIALRLEQRLAEMGYEVIGMSYTGEDCVKKARSLLPDLILMDVMISGDLDGIDSAKIVKDELDIPVIFMTAYTEDQIIERAKEVEPYGYIIKPIRDRELKATIEIALYKKEMERRLQESEEKYRQLFETISDAIIIIDGETRKIVDINDSCLSMYGYSVSELLKTTIKDLAHPDEFKKINKRYKTILAGKPFQRHYETKIIRKDGKELPIEVASAASIWQGQPADIVIIRDISQRNRD